MPQAKRTIVIGRPQPEVFAFFADGETTRSGAWRSS